MSDYQTLRTTDQLEAILTATSGRTVIFKHSLTCPISARALREYEAFLADRGAADSVQMTLIEVQNQRDLSNAVAERTGVRHESPQALVFDAGEVVWHASHGRITAESLTTAVD